MGEGKTLHTHIGDRPSRGAGRQRPTPPSGGVTRPPVSATGGIAISDTRVLALNGSPRKGGNTDLLIDAFLQGAAGVGATCEKVYLDDYLIRPPAELDDVQARRVDLRADDDCRLVLDKVIAAEVLVLGSPVYWQGVTSQMKCFIDRFSCHYAQEWFNTGMRGKVWAALVPYGASDPAEARWVTEPVAVWVRHFKGTYAGEVAVSAFRKGGVADKPEALAAARELGRRSVELVPS